MKRIIATAVIVTMLMLTIVGCGSSMDIDGKTYQCYGVFDQVDIKDPKIQYELVVGNIIWDVLLVETVVVPVLLIGLKLYCPVGVKK